MCVWGGGVFFLQVYFFFLFGLTIHETVVVNLDQVLGLNFE